MSIYLIKAMTMRDGVVGHGMRGSRKRGWCVLL